MNTEISLPASELKTALSGLNRLIGKKTTLPVLSCVRVSRSNDGRVTLQGTDLDAHATFTFKDPQPGQPLDVLVPIEQLTKASKSTKQDLTLICEQKFTTIRFNIGNDPVLQPINTLPVNEWPAAPQITAEASPLQPGFAKTLKEAMQCCSEDHTRAVICGACLDASDQKAHYVVSTNGRFLYAANSFKFPLKEPVIVPDSKFINGNGFLDIEPCFIAVQPGKTATDPKHICLQTKQWQFVTRAISGNYPNWKQVVPSVDKGWTTLKLTSGAIEQLLKVIPNLPGKDCPNKTVRLRITESVLWVDAKGKDDKDWTSCAINEVTVTGKPKVTALNRDYLSLALKFGLAEIAVQDELTPLICSNETKRMVIMPVRLDASAPKPPQPKPEERKQEMPKETPKVQNASPDKKSSSLIDQIEQLKETCKNVLRDLNGLVDAVKQADREKRATEKEVETARAVLKKLQQVSI